MKILLLSPYPEEIIKAFGPKSFVESRVGLDIPYSEDDMRFDWIISYGCRTIIKKDWIDAYKGRIINIHIGLLPWNRGADPNFWSWFDVTPKGITIHQIDEGIDTGPIYSKGEIAFNNIENATLGTTYDDLKKAAAFTFAAIWPSIRDGYLEPYKQEGEGSYHRSVDKMEWFDRLPLGYDTPIVDIIELGRESRWPKQSAS